MKQRSIIELLQLLNDSIKENGLSGNGMCRHIQLMYINDEITGFECEKLDKFIIDNKPKEGDQFYQYKNLGWYFPRGNEELRLEWLEYHINKQKELIK